MVTRVVVPTLGGPELLVVEEGPEPVPGVGQVVVEVEAAGVAFADVLMRQGRYPKKPPLPFTPGYDVVGRVTAVGADVTAFAAGDRLAALTITGSYATACAVGTHWATPVPDGPAAADVCALVLNYVTAWQLLHRVASVGAGGSILVLGAAGGVGSALCELAALDGIEVLGTASPTRHAVLEARGVQVVEAGTLDGRVDAAFDAVGGPSIAASRRAAKPGGVVASYGIAFAVSEGRSRLGGFARHGAALAAARVRPGPRVATYDISARARRHPADLRSDLARLVQLLADGQLHPVVETMALADAAEAQRRLEDRSVVGKLILVP